MRRLGSDTLALTQPRAVHVHRALAPASVCVSEASRVVVTESSVKRLMHDAPPGKGTFNYTCALTTSRSSVRRARSLLRSAQCQACAVAPGSPAGARRRPRTPFRRMVRPVLAPEFSRMLLPRFSKRGLG